MELRKTIRTIIYEAYLSKDAYDKKREYAARKMMRNKEIDSLTDEQHDALSNLCSIRHKLHTNMDKVTKSDNDNIKKDIVIANIQIRESGLNPMEFVPLDEIDYIDIDTIEDLYIYEEDSIPEDEEERQNWLDYNYERIYSELSILNNKIETYLKQIDEQYGTEYCPTGLSRKF